MAFYCSHVARHTVEENENVMIYGPVVMNAEVISYKDSWENVKTVGISQGRQTEKTLAEQSYPQIQEFQEVTQKGLLYTLENQQIDAVIQDLTKAADIPEYPYKPLTNGDYISYVLVVDRDFVETEAFADFVASYNRAVEKLNDPEYFAEKLGVEEDWLKGTAVPTTSGHGAIDLILPGCHKASGLKRLAARRGITPQQCAAFGDGGNDIEMLKYCGYSYAMGNAPQNVKDAAKYVCPSNAEDGVLVTLEKLFPE